MYRYIGTVLQTNNRQPMTTVPIREDENLDDKLSA